MSYLVLQPIMMSGGRKYQTEWRRRCSYKCCWNSRDREGEITARKLVKQHELAKGKSLIDVHYMCIVSLHSFLFCGHCVACLMLTCLFLHCSNIIIVLVL